ncbi:alpha-amylase family glycosyl hydrolase [uncultured Dubosiella sp.]|uniref:alpha-amylase family glycosyl hydrolase n=1 Tax=uncultured Dubosiella sp. TaxID=1937011 RepID=UPI002595A086|nr:alpha-amylase family glycosyl hydrolase [uncultured Dubosiella sp.]
MWYESSVFYQIYPLGACGAPFENDHKKTHRLTRLTSWIPGLKKLGIDCVLLNPVFESISHGYDTTDYTQVDVRLGDNDDLRAFVRQCHDNGIRVILDGVFNHVGRAFAPFADVLQNRENSPYLSWFDIDLNGNNEYDDGLSYQNWEGNANLVKLNLNNPAVVDYLCSIVQDWIDTFDIDGLRLDVAYCLAPDFLRALHTFTKSIRPDFFLMGETLHGDYNQWVNEQMLDSCTNYECYKGLYSSFNTRNFFEILYSFNRQFGNEQWCLYRGKHLFNFVDNHDVERIASILNVKADLPLIYAMLMTMPGIPCLYYGSEWGMEGKKNWNDTALRPAVEALEWNELTDWIHALIAIHHALRPLYEGSYRQVALTNTACVYARELDGETVWTAINLDDSPVDLGVDFQAECVDWLADSQPVFVDWRIQIPAKGAMILTKKS